MKVVCVCVVCVCGVCVVCGVWCGVWLLLTRFNFVCMQWSIHLSIRGLRTIFFNILSTVQSRLVELTLGVGEGSVRIDVITVAF